MKGIFILISVMIAGNFVAAQSVYYGFPTTKELKKDDRIIVNLPKHLHMLFYDTAETTALCKFLNTNHTTKFNISIHLYVDSPEYDLSLSGHLKESLAQILEYKCKQRNYSITARGQSGPIFTQDREATSLYRKMNTRMEILVE